MFQNLRLFGLSLLMSLTLTTAVAQAPAVATPKVAGNSENESDELSDLGDKKVYGNNVYTYVEQMPELLGGGGVVAIAAAIQKEVHYPLMAEASGISGKVFVSFTVGLLGKVSDVKIIKGLIKELNEEAIRATYTLPVFQPGKQNGRTVNVSLTVPVSFTNKKYPTKLNEASVKKADIKIKSDRNRLKDEVVTITTPQGVIRVILFDDTPLHKANFLQKAQNGFYDGTTFHRVIEDFMVQGGDANTKNSDPNDDGMGQPADVTIPAELNPSHQHNYGALAAARQGGPVGTPSSNSQFYFVENHDGTHFLDGKYTVFGQVIQGLEVIDKIAKVPKDDRDRPTTDIKMTMKMEKVKKKKITMLYGYQYPA